MSTADGKSSTSFRRCENCKFWKAHSAPESPIDVGGAVIEPEDTEEQTGECRNQPPAYGGEGPDGWPVTKISDWCGVFKPRPDAAVWRDRVLAPDQVLQIDQYERLQIITRAPAPAPPATPAPRRTITATRPAKAGGK